MKDEVQLKKYLPSLIFAIILPVIAYLFLKMLGNSDTLALGIATAFPVVHMLWSLIRKKELNPVSLVAIIGFLISLLAVYLTHGNNLAFKLWHPILTAAIGTIFLLSVLLNRPLLELASEGENHRKCYMTLFMGLVFIFHALSVILLAFFVETTAFVLLSKVIDFSAVGVLILGLAFLRKKLN
ncbi:VC0807 family protein [Lactococcus cremoris]